MARRNSPSPLFNLPLLIVLIPTLALLLLIFIAIPSLTSNSHKLIKPSTTVKKGWDSLNILLVLFAILCGLFAKRNDDDSSPPQNDNITDNIGGNSTGTDRSTYNSNQNQLFLGQFQLPDHHKLYQDSLQSSTGRLKRSSRSYPDLIKQESSWDTEDDRFRFLDDSNISKFRTSSDHNYQDQYRVRHRGVYEENNVKEIQVDTYVLRPSPPTPPPHPPSPPPPPPQQGRDKERAAHRKISRKEKAAVERRVDIDHDTKAKSPPPPPPPPPRRPPPPTPPHVAAKVAGRRIERKKSNAAKEIKMVLASLYRKRKRKQQTTHKGIASNDNVSVHSPPPEQEQTSFTRQPPSPPPPPPPPPPSVFHSFFKFKGIKNKRIHSFSAPTPPPPPPPPPTASAVQQHQSSTPTSKRPSKRKSQVPPAPPPPLPRNSYDGKPPLPATRPDTFNEENSINCGFQSPLIPMPPPPPPPPFKVPGFRFVVKGDFVRVRSSHSPRCGSPELEAVDDGESSQKVNAMDGRDGAGVFCPSPDVNVKADTFIARLRDGWKLEKMNSMKERSSLGLSPGPSSGQ